MDPSVVVGILLICVVVCIVLYTLIRRCRYYLVDCEWRWFLPRISSKQNHEIPQTYF